MRHVRQIRHVAQIRQGHFNIEKTRIPSYFPVAEEQIVAIEEAIGELIDYVRVDGELCINIVPREDENSYVRIMDNGGLVKINLICIQSDPNTIKVSKISCQAMPN